MITPVAPKTKLTYNDYLKTPDDKRYELIEGELIMTPSPVTYHQWVSKNIEYELERFVREKKTGRVFYAPYDVCLDNENVLQPDILYISRERFNIIGEKNVQGAPDSILNLHLFFRIDRLFTGLLFLNWIYRSITAGLNEIL